MVKINEHSMTTDRFYPLFTGVGYEADHLVKVEIYPVGVQLNGEVYSKLKIVDFLIWNVVNSYDILDQMQEDVLW